LNWRRSQYLETAGVVWRRWSDVWRFMSGWNAGGWHSWWATTPSIVETAEAMWHGLT
jgi:hypothetical protein